MLFELTDKYYTLNSNNTENITILNQNDLTYDQFFQNFMLLNKPCIIKNVTSEWNSSKFWINENDINFNYLREQYGHMDVTVYNCLEKEFNSQKCYDTSFDKYLDYFQAVDKNAESCDRLDYLKNWHLKLNTDDNFYEVPIYFASDWLNEYCVSCLKDDYRFVYMGPKNTWYVAFQLLIKLLYFILWIGHHFMQMCFLQTVGQQMFVEEKSGFSSLLVKSNIIKILWEIYLMMLPKKI